MPRHIRCPECKTEGVLPGGYEKTRIRCPNPNCRHIFEITPGSGASAESETYSLAGADIPVDTVGDTGPRPAPALLPAKPEAADARDQPDRDAGSPAGSPPVPAARRRTRWAAATAGGLALTTVVVGIGAFAIRQNSGSGIHREAEKSARVEDSPRSLPGGAQAEPEPAPEPQVAEDEPTTREVAGGDMAKGEPVGDTPKEDERAAGSALADARADQPPPAGHLPTEPQAPSPEVSSETTPPSPEAAKAEADRVLRSRGLRQKGLVYVLDKEDKVQELMNDMVIKFRNVQDAMARMRVLETEGNRIRANFFELQQQKQAIDDADVRPIPDPTPNRPADPNANQAERMRAQQQQEQERERARQRHREEAHHRQLLRSTLVDAMTRLQLAFTNTESEYNRLGTFVVSERNDLSRGQADLNALFGQIQKDYEDLRNDPEVKDALKTLNRDTRRPLALGPIENYKANVQRMAAGLLAEKGFQRKQGGGLILGADADLQAARSLVKSTRMDLAVALHRSQGLQDGIASRRKREADLAAREARTAAALVDAAEPEKATLTAELDRVRADLAKLREEQADGEKSLKEVTQGVAAKRESFVESVGLLEKAVDASRQKREEVGGDREVEAALKRFKSKITLTLKGNSARRPKSDPDLEEAKKVIQVEEVALVPDRTAPWVTATVNGVQGLRLVLDPSVEAVRVAERFATKVGLVPGPEETPVIVPVPMPDGQVIRARRATLISVQVGNFTAHDVPCLVLLDGYDAPPVLGAGFLDNYLVKIDTDANKLMLTRVNVPPLPPSRPVPSPKKARGKTAPPGGGR